MVYSFIKKKLRHKRFFISFPNLYFVEHIQMDASMTKKIVFAKSFHWKTPVKKSFLVQLQRKGNFITDAFLGKL